MTKQSVLFYALVVIGVLLVVKAVARSLTNHELDSGPLVMALLVGVVALRARPRRA